MWGGGGNGTCFLHCRGKLASGGQAGDEALVTPLRHATTSRPQAFLVIRKRKVKPQRAMPRVSCQDKRDAS